MTVSNFWTRINIRGFEPKTPRITNIYAVILFLKTCWRFTNSHWESNVFKLYIFITKCSWKWQVLTGILARIVSFPYQKHTWKTVEFTRIAMTSNRAESSHFLGAKFPLHWENYVTISFHIEWDMIVVTVFLSIFWTKWNFIWFKKSKGKLSPRSYPI